VATTGPDRTKLNRQRVSSVHCPLPTAQSCPVLSTASCLLPGMHAKTSPSLESQHSFHLCALHCRYITFVYLFRSFLFSCSTRLTFINPVSKLAILFLLLDPSFFQIIHIGLLLCFRHEGQIAIGLRYLRSLQHSLHTSAWRSSRTASSALEPSPRERLATSLFLTYKSVKDTRTTTF
jgi:hypothetical protein